MHYILFIGHVVVYVTIWNSIRWMLEHGIEGE